MSTDIKKQLSSNIALKALEIAISYIGQQEEPKGSNAGPFVEECLRLVGLGKGYAWCQAFVHRCFEEALPPAAERGMMDVNPVVKTGGVAACWRDTKGTKIPFATVFHKPELVKPGDQFIRINADGSGHTGIVERVEGFNLHTVEGNTNDDGDREGYEVCRKVRHVSYLKGGGIIQYL
jgi:hypothetical protein